VGTEESLVEVLAKLDMVLEKLTQLEAKVDMCKKAELSLEDRLYNFTSLEY
jgi:hypothetical protein